MLGNPQLTLIPESASIACTCILLADAAMLASGRRLHRVLGIPQLTLIHQYRMHPLLRDFPSRIWYQGALTEDAAWLERTDLSMPHK